MNHTNFIEKHWRNDLPDWVRVLAAECDRKSPGVVGKKIGVTSFVVCLVLRQKFTGSWETIEAAVESNYMETNQVDTLVISLDFIELATKSWGDDLPEWVRVLATECDLTNQSKVGKKLNYSGSMISQVLRKKYKGNLAAIESAVRGQLLQATVDCPVLDAILSSTCLENQRKPFSAASPQRVQLYHACNGGCPHKVNAGKKGSYRDYLKKAQESWGSDLPSWVESLAKFCMKSSLAYVSDRIGYSLAAISLVLNNKYSGDINAVKEAFNTSINRAINVKIEE
ncbi:hypothetical protein KAR91_29285 [Candidatus Pacearchaeota archaeon]|nr:hypothetical protein [Candidatus Pacearchaeota archaeon]